MPNPELQFHGTSRFRIVSRIGVGAVGEVYKALDEARGTFVALRTLRHIPPEAGQTLLEDFRALKAVRHSTLVGLGEMGRVDGMWFYTMELIEGESIIDYVRPSSGAEAAAGALPNALSEVRLRSAFSQLVRGVAALHRAGRVHGSIEPNHIKVTPHGRVVLFGHKRIQGPDTEQRFLSELPFVAPERLEDAPPSPATDWYSVGAVLYQALSGGSPFSMSGADLVEQKSLICPTLPPGQTYPPDLAKLCHQLLAIDPDARPDYDEIRLRLGISSDAEPRISHTFSLLGDAPPFVGRKRELALLSEAFERTRHGAVSTLCIYGEPGIGIRTLTAQLVRKLRNDYPQLIHLAGRAEHGGPRALRGIAGVVDALGRYLGTQDASSVATLLPHDAGLITQMFPSLKRVIRSTDSVPSPLDPPALRRAALKALQALFRALSKRHPLLVVLDNMQWADQDALSVLEGLLRPPNPPDMLVIMLVHGRLGEVDPPLRAWLERHRQVVTLMPLRALGQAASAELAARLLESGGIRAPEIANEIARIGQGQAVRVDALVRHYLLTEVPAEPERSLEDLIWSRVEHLPLDARQLLVTLCHAHIPLSPETCAQAVNLPLDSIARHIAALRIANLARTVREENRERYCPIHETVRAAVLSRAQVEEARIHHQIALALCADPDAPKDVLAAHFRAAGDKGRAAEASVLAADAARDRWAFDAAVHLYRQALNAPQLPQETVRRLRVELAHAYAGAGQSERAATAYVEAARHESPAQALELERQAAHQLLRTGLVSEGLSMIEGVLARLDLHLPATPLKAKASLLFNRLRLMLRGRRFQERDPSQLAPNDLLRVDTLGSLTVALSMLDAVRGADVATRYVLLALRLGDPVRVARALVMEADYVATVSDVEDERWKAVLSAAETIATRVGDVQAQGLAQAVRATALFWRGKLRQSITLSQEAERTLSMHCAHVDWNIGRARMLRAVARVLVGELKLNAEIISEQLREASECGDRHTLTLLTLSCGYLSWLMAHEPTTALSKLDDALNSFEDQAFRPQHFLHLFAATQVELYARRDRPYARVMAAWPALSRSALLGAPYIAHQAHHLRARAAIAQARGQRADRELLLRDAADAARRLVAARTPFLAGFGYGVRAGIDAVRGHRDAAIQNLERAEAAFYEGDMTLYAAATRFQLGRLQGGHRGMELRVRAEEWLEAQGVRRPISFVAMLLPGFD